MKAKDKVYKRIEELFDRDKINIGITATELEKYLNLKRSVISRYLNLLFDEGKVFKTATRPVRYYLSNNEHNKEDLENEDNVFCEAIGCEGSLKSQIDQCKSAVVYPPKGLPVLIRGKSGVGKSFLAYLIYKYAINKKVIKEDANFVELNCADYANNPELLSAVLFGHIEGAFTGANKNKKGLMDEADGGYLFLDEIHRLSYENQEKLFLYLDKGKFRRLGENDAWHSANVRLIFATTEDVTKTLLETFYRRIPVRITLPEFQQRPLIERVSLIYTLYRTEGKALNKDIEISNEVINLLVSEVKNGNIGMLKNYIKLSCANSYKNNMDKEHISIDIFDLPSDLHIDNKIEYIKEKNETFIIERNKEFNQNLNRKISRISDINIKKIMDDDQNNFGIEFSNMIKLIIKKIRNKMYTLYNLNIDNIEFETTCDQRIKYIYYKLINQFINIKRKYGIYLGTAFQIDLLSIIIYYLYKLDEELFNVDIHNKIKSIKKSQYKVFYIGDIIINSFKDYDCKHNDMLSLLFASVISEVLIVNPKIQALIISHGDSTASSIASVANTLCETYVYEAFDMPITDDSLEMVDKVNKYIDNIDTKQGLVILVDMGSLEKMYEPIKNHIQGELLIINNVTTNIAIDIGLRISREDSFQEIIESAKNHMKTEVRYYEGITQGDNIIISCISGLGISQKLKIIFDKCLENKKLEIITLEYSKLKEIIQYDMISQFKRTKLIITTNELDTSPLHSINIENIMSNKGQEILTIALKDVVSSVEIKKLSDDIIKFFSIEGIADNLTFLNASIVVEEVENVIKQIEIYYNIIFKNNLRLNLYMHISIMIERLMINKVNIYEEDMLIKESTQEFIGVCKSAFSKIVEKYGIKLPLSELMLIYEVIEADLKINTK